jgi:hypothetical protein
VLARANYRFSPGLEIWLYDWRLDRNGRCSTQAFALEPCWEASAWPRSLLLSRTPNESELKRRDDTLAFPSEEHCDLGQCLPRLQLTPTAGLDEGPGVW